MADSLGVKIFSADIIYHLFDAFLKHRQVSFGSCQCTQLVIHVCLFVCLVGSAGEKAS